MNQPTYSTNFVQPGVVGQPTQQNYYGSTNYQQPQYYAPQQTTFITAPPQVSTTQGPIITTVFETKFSDGVFSRFSLDGVPSTVLSSYGLTAHDVEPLISSLNKLLVDHYSSGKSYDTIFVVVLILVIVLGILTMGILVMFIMFVFMIPARKKLFLTRSLNEVTKPKIRAIIFAENQKFFSKNLEFVLSFSSDWSTMGESATLKLIHVAPKNE